MSLRKRSQVLKSSGMTLLEVLISILLFAVFSATFLMVTEMIAQLLPAEEAPAADNSCNGAALEESCVNIAFDAIVPWLEKADPTNLDISSGPYASPNQVPFAEIRDLQLAWPDAYKLSIFQYPQTLRQSAATVSQPSMPGLYLLQATPTRSAFWRKPIQRLFCRPFHRCVRP